MKTPSPALLPLLRSRTQGEVLAQVLLHTDREQSLTEIAEAVGASPATVMREVARAEAAGLVQTTRRGNTRLVRAETNNAVYGPLAELLALTFGPVSILRELLAPVDGIERAFVYGSWAARYHQHPGAVPHDIDVLVIGAPDRDALDDAIESAERKLRREVNVRRVTPEAWESDGGPYKRTVLSSPIVDLIGTGTIGQGDDDG